jgi:Kef-type K+ transport system membrane component KefB
LTLPPPAERSGAGLHRQVASYLLLLLVFAAGTWWVLEQGSRLPPAEGVRRAAPSAVSPAVDAAEAVDTPDGSLGASLIANLQHPLSLLLLQIVVIVLAARSVGALFRRIHQPPVVGEMVAGILLGPSLLGLVAPDAQAFLFPEASLGPLRLLSQIGVILFMFVVGIELNLGQLRKQAFAALLVSHAGIVVPFFLGAAGALFLYRGLAPAGAPFSAFALFLGVSMSVTAFPVLARILEERRLSRQLLGTTAIACAAIGDVTAWCLLAAVVASAQAGSMGSALGMIGLSLLFIAALLLGVRPWLARRVGQGAEPWAGTRLLAAVLVFVFVAALATEVLGLHALFGAFLAGVCMPDDAGIRQFLRERLETFGSVFLLPLFFAFTGLRTQIGLLDDAASWWTCLGIIALATVGKLGGTFGAARATGMGWGDALSLGVLMNTRGLVEIIVLNIGFDLGILTPQIFTMLVLMALVTTFLTAPLISWIGWLRRT